MSGTRVPKHHVGASEQFDLYHVLNPHARCQLAGVSLPETRADTGTWWRRVTGAAARQKSAQMEKALNRFKERLLLFPKKTIEAMAETIEKANTRPEAKSDRVEKIVSCHVQ